ncbi:hypothetical protein ACJX0J_013129, partial [Zea mays]
FPFSSFTKPYKSHFIWILEVFFIWEQSIFVFLENCPFYGATFMIGGHIFFLFDVVYIIVLGNVINKCITLGLQARLASNLLVLIFCLCLLCILKDLLAVLLVLYFFIRERTERVKGGGGGRGDWTTTTLGILFGRHILGLRGYLVHLVIILNFTD